MNKIQCKACSSVIGQQKSYCHECHGLGYIDIDICPSKGNFLKECGKFLSYDPGVNGWECKRCGGSGPLNK